MRKEHIYFMVLFTDGRRAFMNTTLPLWKALHLYYQYDSIQLIRLMTKDEYYENMLN